MMMLISAFLLAIQIRSVVSTSSEPVNLSQTGLTVHTQQGDVQGSLVSPSVRQFLGIPFAVANRWEAPQTPPARRSVLQATKFGDSCVQQLDAASIQFSKLTTGAPPANLTQSEDCLSVNVWAPALARKQGTAVLIWMYGGGFTGGTSNNPIYIGSQFVQNHDDITLVTFNYRLNIFGQPNAPQLVSNTRSQNFGLLDRDAAISWVHANIAAFGGDPERITFFGQSAGSAAVDAYAYSHPSDTIVKGLIEESGTAPGLLVHPNQTFDNSAWANVANAVGCGNATTAQQLSCMRTVPFQKLENAVISTGGAFNIRPDNITVFADTAAREATGNFLHVPLLGGSLTNEEDVFVILQEQLSVGNTIPMVSELMSDVSTQAAFTCPASSAVAARRKSGLPAWRYQYQAIFPDISINPSLRAFHISEIPIVFGTFNPHTASSTEIALSRYVQSVWVAFAKDPKNGLLNLGWPLYEPNTDNTLAILGGLANKTGVVFGSGRFVDATCAGGANVVLGQVTGLIAQLANVVAGSLSSRAA